jgi:hypothetical protein
MRVNFELFHASKSDMPTMNDQQTSITCLKGRPARQLHAALQVDQRLHESGLSAANKSVAADSIEGHVCRQFFDRDDVAVFNLTQLVDFLT